MTGDETFVEWRVTGDPGHGFPPYEFVWSRDRNPHLADPEQAARALVRASLERDNWADGPWLYRRTVTRTAWEQVEP